MKNRQQVFILILFFLAINIQSCNTDKTENENNDTIENTEKPTATKPVDTKPLDRDQMLVLLGAGNATELLRSLANAGNKEAGILGDRLNQANQDFDSQKITFEDWAIEQNRINYGVFRLIPATTKEQEAFSAQELKGFIDNNQLEDALSLLIKAGYEDVILLQARLNLAKQQLEKGTIDQTALDTVYEQIIDFIRAF